MKTVNYSEFRNSLKKNLDAVSDDHEIMIVHRSKGRSVVVLSMDEYNSFKETQYLLSSPQNKEKLEEGIMDTEKGSIEGIAKLIGKL